MGQIYHDNPLLKKLHPHVEGRRARAFLDVKLYRFHLVRDVVDRVPNLGASGAYLKQMMADNLVEHGQYIDEHGEDMPEIRNWKWGDPK